MGKMTLRTEKPFAWHDKLLRKAKAGSRSPIKKAKASSYRSREKVGFRGDEELV